MNENMYEHFSLARMRKVMLYNRTTKYMTKSIAYDDTRSRSSFHKTTATTEKLLKERQSKGQNKYFRSFEIKTRHQY